ncbi:MAG: alpha/beta fold hydrolase, partial [Acidimicrobiia bacterium]
MRARYPDSDGYVERNGARLYYEVYDNDWPTILLAPTWQIVHSRHWKMQIPYLSRHFRVVTYDPVGNGKSDRSLDPERYMLSEDVKDAVAILDETGTETAIAVGFSRGGGLVTALGASHPQRIVGLVAISPSHALGVPLPGRETIGDRMFSEVKDPEGWDKYNLY